MGIADTSKTTQSDEDPTGEDTETCAVPPNIPSKGSAQHGTGKCRPCAWFHKPQGCSNALECSYCHLCDENELKSRKEEKVAAMRKGALIPAKGPSAISTSADQGASAAPSRVLKLSAVI